MKRYIVSLTTAAAVAVFLPGCGSSPAQPAGPTPTPAPVYPVITAPTAQSPVNDQLLTGLTATFTASTATVDLSTYSLQYRFQVFGDNGTLVQDSGLVGAPTWASTLTLTPNKRYTWAARAESQGYAGPWSKTASFNTPDPPPAYNRPIGDWESCASQTDKRALVICVWNAVKPVDSVGDMEVVKRVAWLLRGEGVGLLIKSSGDNVILWQGYPLSCSRVCYANGHIYKLMSDAGPGGTNAPQWADNDFVDPALYVPAIDPRKW
jgi:hypothetical protein